MPNDRPVQVLLAVLIALAFTLVFLLVAIALRGGVRRRRALMRGHIDPRLNPPRERIAHHLAEHRGGLRVRSTEERLAELDELRRRDLIDSDAYTRARARALGSRRTR